MDVSLKAQAHLLLAELGWQSGKVDSIGITSSHSREGASTIAAALAAAAARSSDRVALADISHVGEGPAKSKSSRKRAEPKEANRIAQGVFLIDEDEMSSKIDAGQTWASVVAQLVDEVCRDYDLSIFTLPPVLEDGRSAAIAAKLDANIIVVRSERTSVEDVRRTERVLTRNGVTVSGAVLNRYRD
jgi:Mrp family chromosome partitioning ATPase